MRSVLLVLLLAPAAATASYDTQGTALPLIERHRVGVVAIGVEADQVYGAFAPGQRRLVDLALEGLLSPALELRPLGTTRRDAIVAEIVARNSKFVVWRIQVNDRKLRTAKSIGVGSTVSELRAAYRGASILTGEGGVFVRVEQLSASFALDQSGPGGDRLWQVTSPELVPASVKIRSVLLTE